jgi:hypothetical protein
MKRYGAILGTALLSLAGTAAQAGLITTNPDGSSSATVNYYWTATSPDGKGIYLSDSGNIANISMSDLGSPTAPVSVTFTNNPGDATKTHTSTLPSISNLVLNSGLLGTQTVNFNGGQLAQSLGATPKSYTETLYLVNPNNPSDFVSAAFTGYMYGSVGTNGITSIQGQGAFLDPGPKTLTLDGVQFSAQLIAFSGPGDVAPGAIQAEIDWTPSGGQGGGGGGDGSNGSDSPEPSTLVLSCLGLSFLGAKAWRRRNRS